MPTAPRWRTGGGCVAVGTTRAFSAWSGLSSTGNETALPATLRASRRASTGAASFGASCAGTERTTSGLSEALVSVSATEPSAFAFSSRANTGPWRSFSRATNGTEVAGRLPCSPTVTAPANTTAELPNSASKISWKPSTDRSVIWSLNASARFFTTPGRAWGGLPPPPARGTETSRRSFSGSVTTSGSNTGPVTPAGSWLGRCALSCLAASSRRSASTTGVAAYSISARIFSSEPSGDVKRTRMLGRSGRSSVRVRYTPSGRYRNRYGVRSSW